MPISVACKCGKSFKAKDSLAGKAVKCPGCGNPLRIPTAQAPATQATTQSKPRKKPTAASKSSAPAPKSSLDDLFDEAGFEAHKDDYQGPHCPACAAPMAQNARLCVECGYNTETGKYVKSTIRPVVKKEEKAASGHGAAADSLLTKAAAELHEQKMEDKHQRAQGMPTWAIITALAFIVTLAITMSMLETSLALRISGTVLVAAAYIISFICSILIIIVAFRESILSGILFFVPFVNIVYPLYFVFTHWDECGAYFLTNLAMNLVMVLGFTLIFAGS